MIRHLDVACYDCTYRGSRLLISSAGEKLNPFKKPCPNCNGIVVRPLHSGVYLLCFTNGNGLHAAYKYKAEHYLGRSDNFPFRLSKHRVGDSKVSLIRVIKEAGMGFHVTRTWPNEGWDFERRMKLRGPKRLCPVCNPRVRLL